MTSASAGTDEAQVDPAARRRAARRAENRAEILDAAERVFAHHGFEGGSVRKIGSACGFSAASVYLFFENKQQLLYATLARRGDELVGTMREVSTSNATALEGLHRIVDLAVDFFEARPDFGLLLRRLRGGDLLPGPSLAAFDERDAVFNEATTIIADLIRSGQRSGQIRPGAPHALAHLYEVIINEFVLLAATNPSDGVQLTRAELHDFIAGALAAPANGGGTGG